MEETYLLAALLHVYFHLEISIPDVGLQTLDLACRQRLLLGYE
jgi:hypothetical protein